MAILTKCRANYTIPKTFAFDSNKVSIGNEFFHRTRLWCKKIQLSQVAKLLHLILQN